MHTDGFFFRHYVESNKLNKTDLAKKLGMSKQNIYQLFRSRTFEQATIDNIEKVTGAKWEDMKNVNIVVKVEGSPVPANGVVKETEMVYARDLLEISIKNLTDTGKINAEKEMVMQENITKLINLLEFKLGFSQPDLPEPGQAGTAMAVKNKSGHKDRT